MSLDSTWYRGWRPVVSRCTGPERHWLIGAEEYVRRTEMEKEVHRRCSRSAIGIVDCTDLRVRVALGRWQRSKRRLYAEFIVRILPGSAERTVYLRSTPL